MSRLKSLFKAVVYVFIFISRIRFPSEQPLTEVVRNRYNEDVLRTLRRFEKLDYKQRKINLDLSFLNDCLNSSIIPKFLQFRTANRQLKSSNAYKHCQLKLLKEEIKIKQNKLKSVTQELTLVVNTLRSNVWFVDFAHITSVRMNTNEIRLQKVKSIQDKKFSNLNLEAPKHNPDHIIHNLSSHVLSELEKNLLLKGLNFTIPPNKLNYADYCLRYELLFRDIKNIKKIDAGNLDFLKTKLKETALTSFRNFNQKNNTPSNLSPDEFKALKDLSSINDLIIQKSDKGNSIVLLDRNLYTTRIEELLSDTTKFMKLDIQPGKELQAISKTEERIRKTLHRLSDENKITKFQFDRLKPIGSRPGVLYGLAKIHKELKDGFPPLRPILSAIGTAPYMIAKFLVPLMAGITCNEHTIRNSFEFGKDILQQDSSLYMGSLDVESLFTSIPLDETIDLCCESMYGNRELVSKLSKRDFKDLLTIAVKESSFIFNSSYYTQTDGVAMGSPLGPTLANAFMSHHEKLWLENCPLSICPLYYKRYVDDIFVLFKSKDQLVSFKQYLNTCHPNIKFTSEEEEGGKMPFLDFSISRENGKFVTNVYRKPTFTGLYTNFYSMIPSTYKFGLILTLVHRVFSICSSYKQFSSELDELKIILQKNSFPMWLIDKCIRKFLNKMFVPKRVDTADKNDENKMLRLVIPFLGRSSLELKKHLIKLLKRNLPSGYKFTIVFKSQTKIHQFFKFKDNFPKHMMSHIVYKYTCDRCNAIYYGLTERHVKYRWSEHMGVSPLTGREIVGIKTDIRDHNIICENKAKYDDFKIVARDDKVFNLRIKESLLIRKDKPSINIQKYSTPLQCFN